MIQFNQVSKTFDNGQTFAVKQLSFTLEKGETLVFLGSSGAGKSLIIKMLNRLLTPTSGTIELEGQNIQQRNIFELRRSFGYVFQGIGLFPHLTVQENIALPLQLRKQPATQRLQRAHELLSLVGLKPDIFAKRYPAELSGGQQQRVGVARALSTHPEYLLMDEPFGALDTLVRNDLQQEILRLKKELNQTILLVTHDIFEALLLGDRLAIMHDGIIQQIGKKEEIIRTPLTPFVENFFKKTAEQLHQFSGYF